LGQALSICGNDNTATAVVLSGGIYRCKGLKGKSMEIVRSSKSIVWLKKSAWPKDLLRRFVACNQNKSCGPMRAGAAPKTIVLGHAASSHHAHLHPGARSAAASHGRVGQRSSPKLIKLTNLSAPARCSSLIECLRPLPNPADYTALIAALGLKDPEHLRNASIVSKDAVFNVSKKHSLVQRGAPCAVSARSTFVTLVRTANACLSWKPKSSSSGQGGPPQELRSLEIPTGHYQSLVAHFGLARPEDLRNSTRVTKGMLVGLIRKIGKDKGGRRCFLSEGKPDNFRNLVIKAEFCLLHEE